jgi:hypothetical protein
MLERSIIEILLQANFGGGFLFDAIKREARSKQTAGEEELEAKRMERKRKRASQQASQRQGEGRGRAGRLESPTARATRGGGGGSAEQTDGRRKMSWKPSGWKRSARIPRPGSFAAPR